MYIQSSGEYATQRTQNTEVLYLRVFYSRIHSIVAFMFETFKINSKIFEICKTVINL